MPDTALELTKVQIARREATKPGRVTGKLRIACNAMVYEGMQLDEAARYAGFPIHRLRLALARPYVLQYLRRERQVLRESMCGANIIELARIRSHSRNDNARVNAIKVLERMDTEEHTRPAGSVHAPGMVIQIINTASPMLPKQTTIEHDTEETVT